ncbi:hypothetical protein L6164_006486 [Bauhinia variegata]|uniref:Uncharacterized protein n=1 Tax=Bauhinia variegata TaxID=167791 RepID=A0ACB9PU33_BAUVA|nr:hypothetical protein L6164_006486 [Bauhinia variegata]
MGPNKVIAAAMIVSMIVMLASVVEVGEASRAVKSDFLVETNSDCLECTKACGILPGCDWYTNCGRICQQPPVADGIKAVKPLDDCEKCTVACYVVPNCDPCTMCKNECPNSKCPAPPKGRKH